MKLATTTSDFAKYTPSPIKALEYIREAGFKYVDYSFCSDYEEKHGFFAEDYNTYIKKLKAKLCELGVKLVQAHAPMGAPIADDNAAFIEDTKKCIRACGELGIPNIVVHSGYKKGLSREETFAENKKFFLALYETAEECGVDLLVENFNKMCVEGMYWIDNAQDLIDFIKYADCPRLHAVWDVGHGNMQELAQDEAIKILGSELRALHVQDNDGDADLHMFPLLGTTNIDSLMNGLIDSGYNGYFTLESFRFILPIRKKRPYAKDSRLDMPTLDLKRKSEELLYEIGKFILTSYNCFEE